jgi:branched-chain amino acid transport system substrate-binding protein
MLRTLFTFSILILVLGGCERGPLEPYAESAEEKVHQALDEDSPIVFGIAWPIKKMQATFVDGAQLAMKELNDSGGILGRKLRLIVRDDGNSVDQARPIAREFADDDSVLAVIGHREFEVAMAAAITYELSNTVYIAPAVTNMELTHSGFQFVFRTIPNNIEMAQQLGEFCIGQGYRNLVLLHERDTYGHELAKAFYLYGVNQLGIKFVHRSSFFSSTTDFHEVIARFEEEKFDAIFIASHVEPAAQLIEQSRQMGVTAPYIGVDKLDTGKLWEIAREAAEGTVVPSVYISLEDATPFAEAYCESYGYPPDMWAAQGYDAVKLLAHAMQIARSVAPPVVAATLRYVDPWRGVTGLHSFTKSGDIIGKRYAFEVLRSGVFQPTDNKQYVPLNQCVEKPE